MKLSKEIKLPRHVAIIMDGNGRWAKKRHKPRLFGHRQGALHARDFIEMFAQYKIPYLSLYAFSTENWNRPIAEVQGILKLLEDNLEETVKIANEKNIRINHLGNPDRLPRNIQLKAKEALEATRNNTALTVNIAFNYGGRSEIVAAARKIMDEHIPSDDVDENLFSRYLYTNGMPDPDLFIRTGDEMRLSNFLIWQAAYAELYFTPILWPDFGKHDFDKALKIYSKRQRRFGGLESL
ncbi:MAG: polyprenyl diphosphate synthase [Chloroflexi bacterium]|nr:polyprenyl diphosphate synthase [Chloroflexota bacterium]